MKNNKEEAIELLIEFISSSNSNWWWLVDLHDLGRFVVFSKFCVQKEVSFSEKDFALFFKQEVDWLWKKYKTSDVKILYKKYTEYKTLFYALDEIN